MIAAGLDVTLPAERRRRQAARVFISVKDDDKPVACIIARRLRARGLRDRRDARHGRGARSARASRPRSINKVLEGSPHVVDAIRSGTIAMVVNTTIGAREVRDSYSLRRQTLLANIPYFTTIAAALAACDAIEVGARRRRRARALAAGVGRRVGAVAASASCSDA